MKTHGQLSDAQTQDRLRNAIAQRERQRKDDLRSLMSQPSGRRVVYGLIFGAGRLQSLSFDAGIKDGLCAALHAAKAEGAREAAIDLHNEVKELVPEFFLAMMGEHIRSAAADLAIEMKDQTAGELA